MEARHVDHRAVGAELARAVRIGLEPRQQVLLAVLARPDLAPAVEEALVAGEPVDDRCLLAGEREHVGLVRDGEAAEIADVLAERELAVDGVALHRLVLVVLRGQLRAERLELRAILLSPPHAQVAVAVVLRAGVVEAVADLVADHRADATVVGGVVGLGIEERRLQDRGREDDLVHLRVVVGVDRLRGHEPFLAIDRLAELGEVAGVLEGRGALKVAGEVVRLHFQRGVVAPLVGIADLHRELLELLLRLGLGGVAHPGERVDAAFVGLDEVGDECLHARLAFVHRVHNL